jgi:hypothetical protein
MPRILHTFAVKVRPDLDSSMSNVLHELVAGTAAHHNPVAVGKLDYYTDPYSWGYRWRGFWLEGRRPNSEF